MERLTYNFRFCGQNCWQVKGADNLECSEICEKSEGCNSCPIAKAFDRLAEIENILGDKYNLAELAELVNAKQEGRCVVFPCKPGDDLYWYNDAERKVECQWQGVEGVVVLKDGFGVIDNVENIQEIGTQWTCLTAQECEEKYGVRPQNRHFIERFMEVR